MEFLYFVWALLPLSLFFISARAGVKEYTKAQGREFPVYYLRQAIFCTAFLALTIFVDKLFIEELLEMLPFTESDPRVVRWLLYPAVLCAAALVQHFFDKKSEKRERDEMRARQLKYLQK